MFLQKKKIHIHEIFTIFEYWLFMSKTITNNKKMIKFILFFTEHYNGSTREKFPQSISERIYYISSLSNKTIN